ncbi:MULTISPECIES: TetR/AcrR family transcriptional regulator [Actinomadura]|uniref:TetR/AcrR family transcriptional regulator n=1 Tax=Actinomadura yumaensis TaxID=111807 RepID=A0ABW2CQD0_9ACTN|nr:TetR/AcrR family transcriptional regulator C-terminal domain-containing protein [Actinomadura sp. J1-007]MWK40393.1 TetR family transcriptional regulator [Actinomadura sp. J1-007]
MGKKTADHAERRPLTRELIVQTSIAIIERDGAKALTMRKIATELGVGVMSLYNHVPNKDELLAAVAESVLAGLDVPEREAGPDQDWKLHARAMAGAFRAVAHRYPRSMHLVLTSPAGRMAGGRTAERALALFAAAGFDAATAVNALCAFMSYMIGAQMLEEGALSMTGRPPEDHLDADAEIDLDEIPRVVELADELMRVDPDADFEYGLEMLLCALDRLPRGASKV